MAHEVFISYSHKDKSTADAICAGLEASIENLYVLCKSILEAKAAS